MSERNIRKEVETVLKENNMLPSQSNTSPGLSNEDKQWIQRQSEQQLQKERELWEQQRDTDIEKNPGAYWPGTKQKRPPTTNRSSDQELWDSWVEKEKEERRRATPEYQGHQQWLANQPRPQVVDPSLVDDVNLEQERTKILREEAYKNALSNGFQGTYQQFRDDQAARTSWEHAVKRGATEDSFPEWRAKRDIGLSNRRRALEDAKAAATPNPKKVAANNRALANNQPVPYGSLLRNTTYNNSLLNTITNPAPTPPATSTTPATPPVTNPTSPPPGRKYDKFGPNDYYDAIVNDPANNSTPAPPAGLGNDMLEGIPSHQRPFPEYGIKPDLSSWEGNKGRAVWDESKQEWFPGKGFTEQDLSDAIGEFGSWSNGEWTRRGFHPPWSGITPPSWVDQKPGWQKFLNNFKDDSTYIPDPYSSPTQRQYGAPPERVFGGDQSSGSPEPDESSYEPNSSPALIQPQEVDYGAWSPPTYGVSQTDRAQSHANEAIKNFISRTNDWVLGSGIGGFDKAETDQWLLNSQRFNDSGSIGARKYYHGPPRHTFERGPMPYENHTMYRHHY